MRLFLSREHRQASMYPLRTLLTFVCRSRALKLRSLARRCFVPLPCCPKKDERYKHLVGGKVVVPLSGREIPIIADDYVDMEFGTGALKITPGGLVLRAVRSRGSRRCWRNGHSEVSGVSM